MHLKQIRLENFRNLKEIEIFPSSRFNLIDGPNGSGKTSVLEAIYYLSVAKSFRTRLTSRIINYDASDLLIFGEIVQSNNQSLSVGLKRMRNNALTMRIEGQTIPAIAEITHILPLLLIAPNSHEVVASTPKGRRKLLNWGVFHVKHDFYKEWLQFQKALKQRNSLLKKISLDRKEFDFWTSIFIESAKRIHERYETYITDFMHVFAKFAARLLPEISIEIRYHAGWNQEHTLEESMKAAYDKDRLFGHTHYGPQRADLSFIANGLPAGDVLSQGQQKLLIYSFKLAQGLFLKQQTNKGVIYLLDDMPATLDQTKREVIMQTLSNLEAQIFITGVNLSNLNKALETVSTFHVKHGQIGIK